MPWRLVTAVVTFHFPEVTYRKQKWNGWFTRLFQMRSFHSQTTEWYHNNAGRMIQGSSPQLFRNRGEYPAGPMPRRRAHPWYLRRYIQAGRDHSSGAPKLTNALQAGVAHQHLPLWCDLWRHLCCRPRSWFPCRCTLHPMTSVFATRSGSDGLVGANILDVSSLKLDDKYQTDVWFLQSQV